MAISIGDEAGLEYGANILEVSALKLLQPTRPSGLTCGIDFFTPSHALRLEIYAMLHALCYFLSVGWNHQEIAIRSNF